jgi:hypothetical protein
MAEAQAAVKSMKEAAVEVVEKADMPPPLRMLANRERDATELSKTWKRA